MDRVLEEVWCDVHGEVHKQSDDPYGYEFALSGEEPECGPADWRILWAGRYVSSGDSNE